MRESFKALLAALAGSYAIQPAIAIAQDNGFLPSPQLVVNSPFAGTLWRADIDKNERFVVSASHAGTTTVWQSDNFSNHSLRRFPLRKEENRRSYSPAISPDANLIAYGAPPLADEVGNPIPGTGQIHIFERDTDPSITVPIRTLSIPMRALEIRFSPDGGYLAAVLAGGCGLRVWRTNGWEPVEIRGDDNPGTCCIAGEANHARCQGLPTTYSLSFNPAADAAVWLATAGDNEIRTYHTSGTGVAQLKSMLRSSVGLERPGGISFSPDGQLLAVGDRLIPIVVVLYPGSLQLAEELRPEKEFIEPRKNTQMYLNQVTWLRAPDDGYSLYAGGYLPCHYIEKQADRLQNCIVRWQRLPAKGAPQPIAFGNDTIMTLQGLPKSNRLLAASQRQIDILDANGSPSGKGAATRAFDFRGVSGTGADSDIDVRKFQVSEDAKSVYFEDYAHVDKTGNPLSMRFDLATLSLETIEPRTDGVIERDQDREVVQGWRNTSLKDPIIKTFGKQIQNFINDPLDTSRSVDVYRETGKPKLLLWGTSYHLRLVDPEANVVCELPITSEAYRVKLTNGAKIAVVGHGDGVLRWYKVGASGLGCRFELILSVLIDETTQGAWRILAWRPDGTFAGANFDGAGWLDFPASGPARFINLTEVKTLYDREKVIAALDDYPVGPEARLARNELDMVRQLPQLEITSAMEPLSTNETKQSISFNVSGPLDPEPLLVELNVNGHVVAQKINGATFPAGSLAEIRKAGSYTVEFEIPKAAIPQKTRDDIYFNFRIKTKSTDFRSLREIIREWSGRPEPKPRRLLALLVGVSNYQLPAQPSSLTNLKFAHKDAIDFAELLVKDFSDRTSANTGASLDFESIELALYLSMPTGADQTRLGRFKNKKGIDLQTDTTAVTPGKIKAKLEQFAKISSTGTPREDILLIYFSGHGMIQRMRYNSSKAKHYLLLPGFDVAAPRDKQLERSLSESELIEYLEGMPQEKILLIDACQSTFQPSSTADADFEPFDRDSFAIQLENRVQKTQLFVSSTTGSPSIEQNMLSFEDTYEAYEKNKLFDGAIPPDQKGNGLFTVAFLSALVNPHADLFHPPDGRIEILEIDNFLRYFYDPTITKELVQIREANHRERLPIPVYSPIGKGNGKMYLRSQR